MSEEGLEDGEGSARRGGGEGTGFGQEGRVTVEGAEDEEGQGAGPGVGDVVLEFAVALQRFSGTCLFAKQAVGSVEHQLQFCVDFGVAESDDGEATSEDDGRGEGRD